MKRGSVVRRGVRRGRRKEGSEVRKCVVRGSKVRNEEGEGWKEKLS